MQHMPQNAGGVTFYHLNQKICSSMCTVATATTEKGTPIFRYSLSTILYPCFSRIPHAKTFAAAPTGVIFPPMPVPTSIPKSNGHALIPMISAKLLQTGIINIVYGTLSIKEDAATENHVTNASMNEGSLKPDLTRNSEKSLKSPEALRLNITINIPTMNKKESQSNSKSISLISCLPIYSAIAPTANPTIPTFIPNSGAIAKAGTPNANRAEAPLVTYISSVSTSTFLFIFL